MDRSCTGNKRLFLTEKEYIGDGYVGTAMRSIYNIWPGIAKKTKNQVLNVVKTAGALPAGGYT
jgi:hypothetical protein